MIILPVLLFHFTIDVLRQINKINKIVLISSTCALLGLVSGTRVTFVYEKKVCG